MNGKVPLTLIPGEALIQKVAREFGFDEETARLYLKYITGVQEDTHTLVFRFHGVMNADAI